MLLVDYQLLDILFYQKGKKKNPNSFDHSNLDSLVPKTKLIIPFTPIISVNHRTRCHLRGRNQGRCILVLNERV